MTSTREKIILAGLVIWASRGERSVTARQIGKLIGITGQRVHKIYGSMQAVRDAVAARAVEMDHTAIILQMQASGHPLAPAITGKPLL